MTEAKSCSEKGTKTQNVNIQSLTPLTSRKSADVLHVQFNSGQNDNFLASTLFMLTTSKTRLNYQPIVMVICITLMLWLVSKWFYHDWFANPYKYAAKFASLTATSLMCMSIILSTRVRLLEKWLGGLDKVYQMHKRIGRWAFLIILFHPLFLAFDRLPHVSGFLRAMWFQSPEGNRYIWGQNIGVIALLLFAVLIGLTLFIKIPYHLWKRTHEWFGLALPIVIIHIVLVNANVAHYPLLRIWLYSLLTLAVAGFVYIRFLYRFLGPHFEYTVSSIENMEQIIHLTFAPLRTKMDFKPSQFVYLVIHKKGITPEPHPYSIACGYNLGAEFKLGIKKVGDHTRTLDMLENGDRATVYGPYGHFSEKFLLAERDCIFIGAGIGITPFVGMWHVALHSEDRYAMQDVPERLIHLHPEIIKTWQSPLVNLFYVCRTKEEASFDRDIRQEVIMSHFHGFKAFEERGHHYELYLSSQQGRITAKYIDRRTGGDVRDKYIFLCGPSSMVDSLIRQFIDLGLSRQQIVVEDFNLV